MEKEQENKRPSQEEIQDKTETRLRQVSFIGFRQLFNEKEEIP